MRTVCLPTSRRLAPIPAARRVAPKPTPKATRSDLAIEGTALVFGREFRPEIIGERGLSVIVEPGALDRSLRRASAGKEHIELRLSHTDESLCSTRRGLRVLVYGRRLKFFAIGFAAQVAKRLPDLREASVGLDNCKGEIHRAPSGERIMVVEQADLVEISLVSKGACEGCIVEVTRT